MRFRLMWKLRKMIISLANDVFLRKKKTSFDTHENVPCLNSTLVITTGVEK